jgi:hypothetical protein
MSDQVEISKITGLPKLKRGPAPKPRRLQVRPTFYINPEDVPLFPDNDPRKEVQEVCEQAITDLIQAKRAAKQ